MTTQNDWQTALSASYEQLNNYLVLNVPLFIGALFLILLGCVVAWICSKLTLTSIKVISRLWLKATRDVATTGITEIKSSHAIMVSKAVFWVVMLFFITAATSSLGLDFFSSWLTALLGYVPQILAAIFIVMAGYLLGNIVAVMVESAAESSSISQPNTAGNLAKYAVFFVALVIGIEQLGINIQFITTFLIVIVGVLLFGVALAFGMGSKTFIANIVAARQARIHFRINEHLRIGNVEGTLVEITLTMLLIETNEGRVLLPAKVCLEGADGVSVIVEQNANSSNAVKSAN